MHIKHGLYLLLIIVSISRAADPVMLADSLNTYCYDFVVIDTGEIVFIDNEGCLSIVSPTNPMQIRKFEIQWGNELDEWGNTGNLINLSANSDGGMICFTQFVNIPDGLNIESEFYIPVPLLVAVCRSDGSDADIIGLSIDVGGGPHFDFTRDSRYVFGNPFLECLPSPEAYAEFMSDDGERLPDYLMVDLETGERSGNPSVLGDGYYLNPYSDLAAAGWYPPNTIVDIATQEVLLEDTCINHPTVIGTWVLPDAGLAGSDDGQVLRYSSGTETVNPGLALKVYCMIPDGRYLFSIDGRDTVMLGLINWDTFETSGSLKIPELAGLYCTIKPLSDSNGVVFRNANSLYYFELP